MLSRSEGGAWDSARGEGLGAKVAIDLMNVLKIVEINCVAVNTRILSLSDNEAIGFWNNVECCCSHPFKKVEWTAGPS